MGQESHQEVKSETKERGGLNRRKNDKRRKKRGRGDLKQKTSGSEYG